MDFNRFLYLLDDVSPRRWEGEIPDFVDTDCPHRRIGQAYDKASAMYDHYITGKSPALKLLKKIALGIDKEAEEEYKKASDKLLASLFGGIVLDVPAGTGLYTFEKYAARPEITFVAVEYSWGMLRQAAARVKALGANNIMLMRADVGRLPFKDNSFDAVISLNGIHSFPEKEKAIGQLSRVVKPGGEVHATMVLKGERWLTDLILEAAYFRLGWFARPALDRQELFSILERNGLRLKHNRFLQAATAFITEKPAS